MFSSPTSMDRTYTSPPDRARTRQRHRVGSVVLAGLAILGIAVVSPAAAADSRTMTVNMVSGSGQSFLTIAGKQRSKSDWYDVVATIERTPCEHETFHLGIVAARADGLFQTSFDATVKTPRIRTLGGRRISCSRPLPRGIGRRLTKMLIYPVGSRASEAPFTIVGRRTSASGPRFTGRIKATDIPCPGRYRMSLTFSSGARHIVQRYELVLAEVRVNGRADHRCR